MLKDEVTAAMREGKFFLWSVSSVDDAVELLTGVTAGGRGDDGAYPPDSINGRVEANLKQFVLDLRAFEKKKRDDTELPENTSE
jgi:hypothetical protein